MSKQQKNNNVQPADKLTNIFSLEELFSIPLKAVIDANAYAASTALDIIIKYGFNPGVPALPGSNKFIGNLRMAVFLYNFVDESGRQKAMEVKIPLLSLIPIPMLEVKKAQFEYGIQIISRDYREVTTESKTKKTEKSILAMMSPLNGTSRDKKVIKAENYTGLAANMKVKVDVEKADLPAGILQLLNLGQEAIKGQTNDIPEISTNVSSIDFGKKPQHVLTVMLSAQTGTDTPQPVVGSEIVIELVSSMGKTEDYFDIIIIKEGVQVGDTTSVTATALSVKNGLHGTVSFLLTKKAIIQSPINGFIVVRTYGVQDKLIYFNT